MGFFRWGRVIVDKLRASGKEFKKQRQHAPLATFAA
jgi:hypothetical protein